MKESKIFIDDREFDEMIKKEKNNIPLSNLNETTEETIETIQKIGKIAKERTQVEIDKDYDKRKQNIKKLFGITKDDAQK